MERPDFLCKKSQFNYTKLVIFFQIAKDLCLFWGVIIDVKKTIKKPFRFMISNASFYIS